MKNEKDVVEVVKPCLEIDEQLHLLQKGWLLQKIGWIMIFSVMVAGAFGVFGEGLVSGKRVTSGTSTVEYERFFRYEVEMKIVIESSSHIASVSFPEEYLKKFRIVRFVPEPVNNNTTKRRVKYNFLPAENHIVSLYLISKDYGTAKGTMQVNETDNINLNHFIYP